MIAFNFDIGGDDKKIMFLIFHSIAPTQQLRQHKKKKIPKSESDC